jgi:hydroxymethylbilane synthase
LKQRVRVGTRRSPLARAQTAAVLEEVARVAPEWQVELVLVDTSGDKDQSTGGSPDFTDAIDRALLRGEVDFAVHSAKDLPVALDPRLELVASPRRSDPRDCLVLSTAIRGQSLARGARVGSSSLRRRAQLLRWRPDLDVVEVRGNVDTRIELVRNGRVDAAILAVAGVSRLGRAAEISRILLPEAFLPAPAQGALAVVTRSGDALLAATLRKIDHASTHRCIRAERAFAAALGGDCLMPMGALATAHGTTTSLIGEVLSRDGRRRVRGHRRGSLGGPHQLGAALGRDLLERGASDLLFRARSGS